MKPNTPRTDAAEAEQRKVFFVGGRVLADFARKLERENADLCDLVTALRREVETLERYKRRMEWLHDCSTGCTDPDGFEWGIYRVKWENGQAVAVWQTNSDFSDLDAEMAREASLQNACDEARAKPVASGALFDGPAKDSRK